MTSKKVWDAIGIVALIGLYLLMMDLVAKSQMVLGYALLAGAIIVVTLLYKRGYIIWLWRGKPGPVEVCRRLVPATGYDYWLEWRGYKISPAYFTRHEAEAWAKKHAPDWQETETI